MVADFEFINESEVVIGNKVYHVFNRPWIENLFKIKENKNDNDTPKDSRSSQST